MHAHRSRAALAALLLASACHDSSSGGAASFDATVTDLILNRTDESSAPIAVEGRAFVFPTELDAFDDVLPPDAGPIVPR